jgi:hypothetical protein
VGAAELEAIVDQMEDIEILALFVQADEAAGEPQTFVMTYVGFGERAWVGVLGWPDDLEVPSEHKMDDLAERGWLRILDTQARRGRSLSLSRAAMLGRRTLSSRLAIPERLISVGTRHA